MPNSPRAEGADYCELVLERWLNDALDRFNSGLLFGASMQIESEQDDRAMWIAFCAVKFVVPKKYGAGRYYVQFKNCLLQKGILLMMELSSKSIVSERSFKSLNIDDLRQLSEVALRDLHHLFTRKPETGERYKN